MRFVLSTTQACGESHLAISVTLSPDRLLGLETCWARPLPYKAGIVCTTSAPPVSWASSWRYMQVTLRADRDCVGPSASHGQCSLIAGLSITL